jgi:thiol:disulfide interchange protein DsbD
VERGLTLAEIQPLLSSLQPQYFSPALEVERLGSALFLGLIAGILLNLMPCVLPVVSLKFSALMAVTAMTDKQAQAKAFRLYCLVFAAGVMAWFLVLAVLVGCAGLAWGEMFQNPFVITALALLLFLLGLSLFGVFSLPVFDLKVSSPSHPHWQAFAGGMLATLLATPCSGPMLGGVLGWALRQPLPVLTLCIVSVGIGMSLPYGVLAFFPRLVHLLPRPGNWTRRLEQLLGFFLMGSVAYLVSLLPAEWVPAFLMNMFAIAFAAWLWGQIGHLGASTLRRCIARVLAALIVALALWWGKISLQTDVAWEPFDPVVFSEILGKDPLLVEFTADWCPSCKALEHTTLNETRMARLRERYKMRTIRVDMTRDAEIGKELLKSLGSGSIPVLALFPKGEASKKPLVLRDIITPSQLKEALSDMF